jgi:hypothetical protein
MFFSLEMPRGRPERQASIASRIEPRDPFFAAETSLEHDPEKWEPVFGKDHAPTKNWIRMTIQMKRHPDPGTTNSGLRIIYLG